MNLHRLAQSAVQCVYSMYTVTQYLYSTHCMHLQLFAYMCAYSCTCHPFQEVVCASGTALRNLSPLCNGIRNGVEPSRLLPSGGQPEEGTISSLLGFHLFSHPAVSVLPSLLTGPGGMIQKVLPALLTGPVGTTRIAGHAMCNLCPSCTCSRLVHVPAVCRSCAAGSSARLG